MLTYLYRKVGFVMLDCEKFAKFAMPRCIFFAGTGVATLLYPAFLRSAVFYAVVGYLLLCGIWSIADGFLGGKETKTPTRYKNFAIPVLMIAFGVVSILYGRYLVHLAPLYLSGLLLGHGIVYFVVALWNKTKIQWLLILLSISIFIGGGVMIVFTFGFEIILSLAQVSGATGWLAAAYELVTCLSRRKLKSDCLKRGETT